MRDERLELFCRLVLPHHAAAHRLARSLTANPEDAEDVVQEALLRAFKYFDSFAGGSARGWLLTIVRNTFSRWSEARHPTKLFASSTALGEIWLGNDTEETDPEFIADAMLNGARLRQLIAELPPAFRETIVLRELKELSYREIALRTAVPIGTVMSRLARARDRLRQEWSRGPRSAGKITGAPTSVAKQSLAVRAGPSVHLPL